MLSLLISAISFVFVTFLTITGRFEYIDVLISQSIYRFRTPSFTTLMTAVSFFSGTVVLLCLSTAIFVFLWKRYPHWAAHFALTMSLGAILNAFLKVVFRLPRPQLSPLYLETDFRYPSGHAMNNLVFWALLSSTFLVSSRHLRFFPIVIVLLVGFSRLYLGVHYPSDILGGYLFGCTWFAISSMVKKKFR